MATTLTNTTFLTTYKDDFRDSDGYHRILFNSGKALQARELTQIQTFLQNQIQRFGDNIFKEGAVVKPGGANLNQKYEFIKLDTTINDLPTDTSILLNATFQGATSSVQFKVLQVVAAEASDPATLYVQYISTPSGSAGASTVRITAGENLTGSGTASGTTLTAQTINTTANPAVGVGILATLKSGIYYARGHFVFTEDQSKIISKYSDNLNADLGFKVVEDIVTTDDDNDLFDNQGAIPDISAPGADRYRIQLTIALKTDVAADENFVQVATIKKGVIFNAVDTNDAYNIPNQLIATRIYENSGDYIVKPFTTRFELDSESTHLLLETSPGVAVVDGYRSARSFPTTLRIQKPATTTTLNNDTIGLDFGNYVIVNPNVDSSVAGLPNINTFEEFTLKDSAVFSAGTTLGTTRVKAIAEDGINLRYYLFDTKMNSGKAFRNVKSIGTSSTNYFLPSLENNKAVLKEAGNNTSIFPLPRNRPQSLADLSFTVQRRFTATANGSGQATLTGLTGETYVNQGDWIIGTDSDIFQPSTLTGSATITLSGGGTGATITGLPPSAAVEVLAYVNKSNPTIKTKTLTTRSDTITIDSDGNGQKFLPLYKADIYEVDEILKAGDSTTNLSHVFELDNGQRDNHYALGKLNVAGGQSAPNSNVFVKYKYFEHGISGDLFAVNSYTGQVAYNKIPTFRTGTGKTVNLRDFVDFRSVMDSAGSFADATKGARVIEVPQPQSLVTSDITYFLGRAGKLVIDRNGIIRYVQGTPSFKPKPPIKPDQTLALYDIFMNANTDDDSDVTVNKVEHKRHTMKDISVLEKRIDNLENLTSLNLLELDTKHLQVLDSSGTDRTKTGFFVDNFTDHSRSSIIIGEYRAALDPLDHCIRPLFKEDNVRLIYDSAASTNTIKKGDNIYMSFDEALYINQPDASKAIAINPFAVVDYEGVVTLSPASDEWREVDIRSTKTIPGGTRLSTHQAFNWNNWSWSWGGVPLEKLNIGSQTNLQNNMVNRIVSSETVLDLVEDRVIQTAFLPFMRSRKVFFRAQGLRPNTRMFAFLDGKLLDNLFKEESFQFYGDTTVDFGNTLKNVTAHPDTASNLVTDANGTVEGSFIVPNNATLRIRTGAKEFKIMDISADNEEGAASIAKAIYTATGYLDTKEQTFATTRVLNVQGFAVQTYRDYGGDDGGPTGTGTEIDADNNHGDNTFDNDHSNNDISGDVEAGSNASAGIDEAPGDNSYSA